MYAYDDQGYDQSYDAYNDPAQQDKSAPDMYFANDSYYPPQDDGYHYYDDVGAS